jgi:hypothetical protein
LNDVSVAFNGLTSVINCGSEGTVDDLADNAFTVEGWFECPVRPSHHAFFSKGNISTGWYVRLRDSSGIAVQIKCATTNALFEGGTQYKDGRPHHYAFTWDDAGGADRKVKLFVDGAYIGASNLGVGAITTDVTSDLLMGMVVTWVGSASPITSVTLLTSPHPHVSLALPMTPIPCACSQ